MTHEITTPAPGGFLSTATRSTTSTARALLACGVVAGPLFILTIWIQALTRPGFNVARHPPSLLSLGDLGWIQITNFVVSGLLFIAAAVGMLRIMRGTPGGTWGPSLLGVVGASMIVGGVFTADPGLGFPAGAPAGQPSSMSWHAMVHFSGFGIGFFSLVAACFVFARRFGALGQGGWAIYAASCGGLVAAAFVVFMSGLSRGNLIPLYLAVMVGWSWASAVSARSMVVDRD